MKTIQHKIPLLCALALAFALSIALILATKVRAFEEDDDNYIAAGEIINDDMLISGTIITIDGTVNGDVIIAAQKAIINGVINGNLILNTNMTEINGFVSGSVAFAGQELLINSSVAGSVYFAGANLILTPEAQINRNILFAGYNLEAQPGSIVGTDIHGTGYQINLAGFTGHNILVDVVAADVSGRVSGDATFTIGAPNITPPNITWLQIWSNFWEVEKLPDKLTPGLRISSEAEIRGKLTYKSPADQSNTILIEPGAGVEYVKVETTGAEKTIIGLWLFAHVRELLTLLAFGALAIWLTPSAVHESGIQLRHQPLKAFGWGILSLILGYVAIVVILGLVIVLGVLLAIITLGGLASAILGVGISGWLTIAGVFTLLVVYGSKVIVASWLGDVTLARLRPEGTTHRNLFVMMVGIGIYMVLRLIPVVSPIVGVISTLLGLGALAMAFISRRHSKEQMVES